jgi:mannose-6-phosphate isomerase-like protein (cupin superfamily)
MPFRPQPDDELKIGESLYRFAEHPAAPGMAYGQSGRRGTVYQIMGASGKVWALKVFLRQYREPRLVGQAERIESYASMPGLYACDRTVLTSSQYVDLIREHRELAYAVLMPWIKGKTWMEVIVGEETLSPSESLRYAQALITVLVGLEERGLAHCDLSGPNTILTPAQRIELVDLEEMFVPGLLPPSSLPGGSPGYAHKTAPQGLWSPESDRFAGALLLGEMLGWCDKRVREAAWGEGYFEPAEMQSNCERFRVLKIVLEECWGKDLADSFEQAWFSDTLRICPTFTEWLAALPEAAPEFRDKEIEAKERAHPVPESNRKDLEEQTWIGEEAVPAETVTAWQEVEISEVASIDEGESWTCTECGKLVQGNQEICPFCEVGRRDVKAKPTKAPVTAPVADPGSPREIVGETKLEDKPKSKLESVESKGMSALPRKYLIWGGLGALLVILTCAIGGFFAVRALTGDDIKPTETVVAVAGEITTSTEVANDSPTENPTENVAVSPATTVATEVPDPTETPPATDTPLPSSTPTATMVPIPEGEYVHAIEEGRYYLLDLGSVATSALGWVITPPTGQVTLEGVPFMIRTGDKVVIETQQHFLPDNPTDVVLEVDIEGPSKVYVLMVGAGGYAGVQEDWAWEEFGQIILWFEDGSSHITPIVACENIRETWTYMHDEYGLEVCAPDGGDWVNVWQEGQDRGGEGAFAFIDRFEIDVPSALSSSRLVAIQIQDTSEEMVDSMSPSILICGITVKE